jgi:hypothetical protein
MNKISGHTDKQLARIARIYLHEMKSDIERKKYYIQNRRPHQFQPSYWNLDWVIQAAKMCKACGKPWIMHAHVRLPWPQEDPKNNIVHFCCKSFNGRKWGKFFELDPEMTEWAYGVLAVKHSIDFSKKSLV